MSDREQRFVFNEVADLYEQARPGYPDAMFDGLVALAGLRAGSRVLEVGCGTGKATTGLARRGCRMVCLEPGTSLAQVARETLRTFPAVEVISETFESWPLERDAFDLVFAAQSFHWLAPDLRFHRSADALRANGSLAVIGNTSLLEATPVRLALKAVYDEHAPALTSLIYGGFYRDPSAIQRLFDESGRFGEVIHRAYPWTRVFTADGYLDLLRTQSDHRMLAHEQRERLLNGVRDVIERFGGTMTTQYEARLHIARRTS